jgi:hypothetical protein
MHGGWFDALSDMNDGMLLRELCDLLFRGLIIPLFDLSSIENVERS